MRFSMKHSRRRRRMRISKKRISRLFYLKNPTEKLSKNEKAILLPKYKYNYLLLGKSIAFYSLFQKLDAPMC